MLPTTAIPEPAGRKKRAKKRSWTSFIMQACILIAIAFLIATNLYFYYTRTIGARGMDSSRRAAADAALRAVEVETWDRHSISDMHRYLQHICGFRGVSNGDQHHMKNNKGPTHASMDVLKELEKRYDSEREAGKDFPPPKPPHNSKAVWRTLEYSCFSQTGDDGLLMRIFGVLGWGARRSIEIGYAPHEGNSVNLAANHGFDSLFLDGFTKEEVSQAWWSSLAEYAKLVKNDLEKEENGEARVFDQYQSTELSMGDLRKSCGPSCARGCYNVNCNIAKETGGEERVSNKMPRFAKALLTKKTVRGLIESKFQGIDVWGPQGTDYFSIDIDGMEYHLLSHMLEQGFRPRVITSEFASHLGPQVAVTRPYADDFAAGSQSWQYGASATALRKLCKRHGYRFIGCVDWNVYFIAESELPRGSVGDRAFPEISTDMCFNTDSATLRSEKERLDQALKVKWQEVETDNPRGWTDLKRAMLSQDVPF